MTGIMQLIKIILCTASFILLCTASLKINLNESERARQFPMPVIAFVYCLVVLIFLNGIYGVATELVAYGVKTLPALRQLKLQKYLVYLVNLLMVAGFLIVKLIALHVLKKKHHAAEGLIETACGWCYEYDKELDKWFIKPEYSQIRFPCGKASIIRRSACRHLYLCCHSTFRHLRHSGRYFIPVFGLIVAWAK